MAHEHHDLHAALGRLLVAHTDFEHSVRSLLIALTRPAIPVASDHHPYLQAMYQLAMEIDAGRALRIIEEQLAAHSDDARRQWERVRPDAIRMAAHRGDLLHAELFWEKNEERGHEALLVRRHGNFDEMSEVEIGAEIGACEGAAGRLLELTFTIDHERHAALR